LSFVQPFQLISSINAIDTGAWTNFHPSGTAYAASACSIDYAIRNRQAAGPQRQGARRILQIQL